MHTHISKGGLWHVQILRLVHSHHLDHVEVVETDGQGQTTEYATMRNREEEYGGQKERGGREEQDEREWRNHSGVWHGSTRERKTRKRQTMNQHVFRNKDFLNEK